MSRCSSNWPSVVVGSHGGGWDEWLELCVSTFRRENRVARPYLHVFVHFLPFGHRPQIHHGHLYQIIRIPPHQQNLRKLGLVETAGHRNRLHHRYGSSVVELAWIAYRSAHDEIRPLKILQNYGHIWVGQNRRIRLADLFRGVAQRKSLHMDRTL